MIRKDLQRVSESRAALRRLSIAELLEICRRAADLFLNEPLPLGVDGQVQTAQQYLEAYASAVEAYASPAAARPRATAA